MRPHLPALDALRGLAVLIVFVSHAANDGMLPRWLGDGFGQMGVQLFFVLSGYLMMRLYGQTPITRRGARLFAAGRIARIVPLYGLVLLASLVLASLVGTAHYQFETAGDLARAALFIVAPRELWSIPVEMQFYLLFVVIWACCPLIGERIVWLLPVALVLAALWRGLISEAMILVPYLGAFVLGLVIRHLEHRLAPLIAWLSDPRIAALCLFVFVLNMPGLRGMAGLELTDRFYAKIWLDPVRLAALTALFLSTLGPDARLWHLPTGLNRLGVLSFCVYLLHRPILKFAQDLDLYGPLLAVICLGVAITLAEASMRWIERPLGRRLKARLGGQMRPTPQPVPG